MLQQQLGARDVRQRRHVQRNLGQHDLRVGSRAHVYSVASAYDSPSQVQRYVSEKSVDYPVLLGGDDLASSYRVEAYPTLYFLDSNGRIKHSAVGYTSTAGLLLRLLF